MRLLWLLTMSYFSPRGYDFYIDESYRREENTAKEMKNKQHKSDNQNKL